MSPSIDDLVKKAEAGTFTAETLGTCIYRCVGYDAFHYLSLKLVDKNKDGIVVRGAKINISGAFASHELVVLPQAAHFEGEEDYAVAFAIPTDAKGITYVCQYSPYSAEREQADDLEELGNSVFGQRETSMVIFEDGFVPWERVLSLW